MSFLCSFFKKICKEIFDEGILHVFLDVIWAWKVDNVKGASSVVRPENADPPFRRRLGHYDA